MNVLQTDNAATTDGKLFCYFIASIVASEMRIRLGEFMRRRSWSISRVIKEMEKIRICVVDEHRRLISPATKTQREILVLSGLSYHDLMNYAMKYSLGDLPPEA